MKKYEPYVRGVLNSWQLWMGIAWLAIIATLVGLVLVRNQSYETATALQRQEALHTTEIKSTAQSSYNGCVQSIPELRRISVHLRGVNQLATAVLLNAKALLDLSSKNDPNYQVRVENYMRLLDATRRIAAVQELPVPTLDDCRARRATILLVGGVGGKKK